MRKAKNIEELRVERQLFFKYSKSCLTVLTQWPGAGPVVHWEPTCVPTYPRLLHALQCHMPSMHRSSPGIRSTAKPHHQNASGIFALSHTYAKLIKIQKIYLQKIHVLHELGSHMECNDTLHGSELGPLWVLGPKNTKLVPWDQINLLKNFFTQS